MQSATVTVWWVWQAVLVCVPVIVFVMLQWVGPWSLRRKLDELKETVDRGFDSIEKNFDHLDNRLDQIDEKLDAIERAIDRIEEAEASRSTKPVPLTSNSDLISNN